MKDCSVVTATYDLGEGVKGTIGIVGPDVYKRQSIYGAVREQMDELDTLLIPYESCPGVSACFGAAASLNICLLYTSRCV